jgi:O-methyltransferase
MSENNLDQGIAGLPGLDRWRLPSWASFLNRVLTKLRSPVDLRCRFDYREDMVSVEQAANFDLLISQLLQARVPGEFVEMGCYVGRTASIFATLLQRHDASRKLHVFDRFDIELGASEGIRAQFEANLRATGAPMPVINQGDLFETVPGALPERIAFAHIDLGVGSDTALHERLVSHALQHAYPRMSPGGIIVVMDYHIPGITVHGYDANPGARPATDRFLQGKPEKAHLLYGGACSHAYIRKG